MHRWTDEQKDFVKCHIKGKTIPELLPMLNAAFGLELKANQLKAFVKNHKLTSGVNTRFKKGQVAFNKGQKRTWSCGVETQFQKGHIPKNYRPVGSERLSKEGYIEIKTADPNTWKGKHVWLWEQQNGPVPTGYVVIFGDRNNRNFDLNNLILVSRKQLLTLNRYGLIKRDAEATRTGVIIADLHNKIAELKRKE